MIAVAFLFAGIRWLRKPSLRSNFLWSFVLAAAYLVSLPLTLTSEGVNGAHFTWPSTYVGVALLPAALVTLFELDKRRPWLKRTAATVGAAVLAVRARRERRSGYIARPSIPWALRVRL